VIKALSVAMLGLLAIAGQMPPAAAQAPSKPLRHLQYSFVVDYEGVSEYHFNGIAYSNSGVGGVNSSEGGRGTMDVDVLSIASDGALQARISEWVQNEPHPGQAYTCTVYGNTAVLCPSVPAPSAAEWVLLSYLGRQFVDGAPWDAQHHWQRKSDTPQYSLVEDFTMAPSSDDKRALIHETKKMVLHNGDFSTQTEDVVIHYDRAMEVPVAVNDQLQDAGTGGSGHSEYAFNLVSDSFAKAPPASKP
jgi:hypothetical protein